MPKRRKGRCVECGEVRTLLSADRCYSCVLSGRQKAEQDRSKPNGAERGDKAAARLNGNILAEAAELMGNLSVKMRRLREQHRALRLAYIKLRDELRETEKEMVAAATAEPDDSK